MPDLQTNQSKDAANAAGADPLAKLHKMSTTAGLGSGDYVAVNIVAVVTALLGIASALSKLSNALLIIPFAAVICGIIALVQVSRSNGTQTGKGIAIVGLILALGLGGWVVAQQVGDFYRNVEDEKAIAGLVQNLGKQMIGHDADAAYALFGDEFHQKINEDAFKSKLSFFDSPQAVELYGRLKNIEYNGHLQFDIDTRTSEQIAGGVALMNFDKKGEPIRQPVFFRKAGTTWKIEAMNELFPAPKAAPGAAPAAPGAPGQ